MGNQRVTRTLGVWSLLVFAVPLFAQRPPFPSVNVSYLRVQFFQPGARPAALGGAFVGAVRDETAPVINPAGMTYLTSIGTSLHQMLTQVKYEETAGIDEAAKEFTTENFNQSMVSVVVPLQVVRPLEGTWLGKMAVGIYRHALVDSRFEFETNQFLTTSEPLDVYRVLAGNGTVPGRNVTLDLELVNNAFALAYPINRRLNFGFSGKISVMNFTLLEQTYLDPLVVTGQAPRANRAETTYSITSGDDRDTQFSFDVGLMGTLIRDKLFAGLVYRYNPTFEFTVNTFYPEYRIASLELPRAATRQLLRFPVPDSYAIGLYYAPTPQLRFTFDLQRIRYSELLSGQENLDWPADNQYVAESQRYVDMGRNPDFAVDDATEVHVGMEIVPRIAKLGLVPLRFGFFTQSRNRVYWSEPNSVLRKVFPEGRNTISFTLGSGVVIGTFLTFDGALVFSEDSFSLVGSTLLTLNF